MRELLGRLRADRRVILLVAVLMVASAVLVALLARFDAYRRLLDLVS